MAFACRPCFVVLVGEHVRVQPADVLRHEVVPRQDPHHRRPLHNTKESQFVSRRMRKNHRGNGGVGWHTYPLRPRHDAHVAEAESAEQRGGLGQRHGLHDGVRRPVGDGVEVHVHVHLLLGELQVLHLEALAGAGLGEVERRERAEHLGGAGLDAGSREDPPLQQHQQVGAQDEAAQLRRRRQRRVLDHGEPVVARALQRLDDGAHALDAGESDERAGHHVAGHQAARARRGVHLQVREPLHAHDLLVHPLVEAVRHRLGDEQHEHDERQQEQVVGELQQDDAHRHRHPHRPAEERRGAEQREEPRVEAADRAQQRAHQAAERGARQDDGDEEARRHGHAVGEQAQGVHRGEEGEQRRHAELPVVVPPGAQEVADGVVVGVEEERRQRVVVPRRALEVLEIARPADGRALGLGELGRAGGARRQPWQAEGAARSDHRDGHRQDDLVARALPANLNAASGQCPI